MSSAKFQCSQCPKVFCHKRSLARHVKEVHLQTSKKHKCDRCGGQFRDKFNLRTHKLACCGDEPAQKKQKTDQENIDWEINNIPDEMMEDWVGPLFDDEQDGGQHEECALDENATIHKYNPNKQEKYDMLLALQGKKNTIINNLKKQLQKKKGIKWYISVKVRMIIISPDGPDQIAEPHFRSICNTTINIENIEKEYLQAVEKIKTPFLEYQREGSGWQLDEVLYIDVGVVTYKPLKGATYIPLPKRIRNKKAILNIKNSDEKCFTWSILAALHPIDRRHNPQRVNHYQQYEHELNMLGIKYPVELKQIPKIERQNNISINIFGLDSNELSPVYITKEKKVRHIIYYYSVRVKRDIIVSLKI